MVIEPKFDFNAINKRIAEYQKRIILAQILTLRFLGEECVKRARINADFIDQTGNLRSLIGYILFQDGVALSSYFKKVKKGSDGTNEGRKLALQVGSENDEGLVLVVVAGMEYALAVESRGRDVLTSTEHFAKQELPRMLSDLKLNIKNMDV